MKKILVVTLISLCFSCTTAKKVACAAQTDAAKAISVAVAASLACTNVAAVQTSLMDTFNKSNVCPKPTGMLKGPIGASVCPIAVGLTMDLLNGTVPQAWGCNPSATIGSLSTVITAACQSAVPF